MAARQSPQWQLAALLDSGAGRRKGVAEDRVDVVGEAEGGGADETVYVPGQAVRDRLGELESVLGAGGGGDDASDDASDGGASDGK